MNPIMFSLGSFEIKWYSFFLLIAVFLGITLLILESKKFNYSKDLIFNMAFWTIIFAFLGARIYYVIFNWSVYANDPLSIFKVWEGGLAIHGGLICGIITIYLYTKKHHLNFIKIIDMATLPVIIGQAIGRWGNFFNMEAHGKMVSKAFLQKLHLPNFIIEGMNINGTYYHPTFFYESLWCLLGALIIILIRKNPKIKNGFQTAFYLMWYSIGRFFIESLRTDSLMLSSFKVAQIISVILFIIAIGIFIYLAKQNKNENLYYEGVKK